MLTDFQTPFLGTPLVPLRPLDLTVPARRAFDRPLPQAKTGIPCRHRLNGYLASWVPSPPGKHTFKNFAI